MNSSNGANHTTNNKNASYKTDFDLQSIDFSSLVEYTLIRNWFLNAFSLDQMGESNLNANAKYGTSFGWGASSLASDKYSSYSDSVYVLINESIADNAKANPLSSIFEKCLILSLSVSSSSMQKAGVINLYPHLVAFTTKDLVNEALLKNENNMLASTTKTIYINPCLLATRLLRSSPNLSANSSVISLFSRSLSNICSNRSFQSASFIAPSAISDNSEGFSADSVRTSPGTLTITSDIADTNHINYLASLYNFGSSDDLYLHIPKVSHRYTQIHTDKYDQSVPIRENLWLRNGGWGDSKLNTLTKILTEGVI